MLFSGVQWLFTIAIAIVLFNGAICSRCYSCTGITKHDNICTDPVNALDLLEVKCKGDCTKSILVSKGDTLVMRGCREKLTCNNTDTECYHCAEDLCISSTKVFPSLIFISFIGLIVNIRWVF